EAPHRIRSTLQDLLGVAGDRPILVAREMTKKHEELVRGPISEVVQSLSEPCGEFMVVVQASLLLGHTTQYVQAEAPGDADLLAQLGCLTISGKLSRRQAINEIARRHRLAPNHVYAAIERARKSVI